MSDEQHLDQYPGDIKDEVSAPNWQMERAKSFIPEPSSGGSMHEPKPSATTTSTEPTELDILRYAKDEFSLEKEKQIMKRLFNAFDMTQQGVLDEQGVTDLCQYLGKPVTGDGSVSQHRFAADELKKSGDVTFDKFWNWWQDFSLQSKGAAFEMVSAEFGVPYHEHQLLAVEEGEKFTGEYAINFKLQDLETGQVYPCSPWHDIPLITRDLVRVTPVNIPSNHYNFICEIPKWTRAKFEIATRLKFNPIKQDIKNGVPRFYKHGDMMWNYGAFPQTWESTTTEFLDGIKGDNDPIDAIEIGMKQMKTGEVQKVKILGVLGMIDDGEMDWKVICINLRDPFAGFLKDIQDIPKYLPGCLDALREWLRVYKICQGGVENKFAFDGEYKDKEFAKKIVHESHLMWQNLKKIEGKSHFGKK